MSSCSPCPCAPRTWSCCRVRCSQARWSSQLSYPRSLWLPAQSCTARDSPRRSSTRAGTAWDAPDAAAGRHACADAAERLSVPRLRGAAPGGRRRRKRRAGHRHGPARAAAARGAADPVGAAARLARRSPRSGRRRSMQLIARVRGAGARRRCRPSPRGRRRRGRRAAETRSSICSRSSRPALARECRRAERLIRRLCDAGAHAAAASRVAGDRAGCGTRPGAGRACACASIASTRSTAGRAILDYKSGRRGHPDWYGERPTHPQLLAYLGRARRGRGGARHRERDRARGALHRRRARGASCCPRCKARGRAARPPMLAAAAARLARADRATDPRLPRRGCARGSGPGRLRLLPRHRHLPDPGAHRGGARAAQADDADE